MEGVNMKTCIKNVRIIDGKGGVIERGYIVFEEQKIIKVSEGNSQTDSDFTIDGTGMTVLPGMIDCHVHLGLDCSPDPFAQAIKDTEASIAFKVCQQGQQFIESGVTTVRSLGTKFNVDISYRNAIHNNQKCETGREIVFPIKKEKSDSQKGFLPKKNLLERSKLWML